jgi:hypothetical protein
LSPTDGHDGNAGFEKHAVFAQFLALSADGKADAATNCDGLAKYERNALFAVAVELKNVTIENHNA